MKKDLFLAILGLLLICSGGLKAQAFQDTPVLPYQTNRSPLFGKDIVLNPRPDENQHTVRVCSAYNGWLYAIYSYDSLGYLWHTVIKSEDNGINWSLLLNEMFPDQNCFFQSLDIMVLGNTITNLKLYFASVITNNNLLGYGVGWVVRYNAITGVWEKTLFETDHIRDISFTSDFLFPADFADPYSIGVTISMKGYSDDEYLYYYSSANGGESLVINDTLGISDKPFLDLSLAYGRSPSWSSGRYYAVWEQADNVNSPTGHIYTAHTEPNFNSPFTKPVCIDSLDPSAINLCRNPVIACQYNDTDNDSANLTTVILYEQYDPLNDRFDVKGVYNLQSTLTSYFKPISFTNPAHENIQPDIAFNPYTSKFMATWYDATDHKLPFVTNNLNFQQPNDWTIVSAGYNDAPDLEDPNPKVRLNFNEQKGINVWRSEGAGGNGVALFDAEYSTWTSVSEINQGEGERLLGAYPNPCNQYLNIVFELEKTEKVTIRLYNLTGQGLELLCEQAYPSGKNIFRTATADLSPGTYIYSFKAGEFSGYGKFCIVR